MKQHEAVIETLEKLGGIATLAQIYQNVFQFPECQWKTKTPLATVRRIVQTRPADIFKIRPGLYALESQRKSIESQGIIPETAKNFNSAEVQQFGHTYYQGLLLMLGEMKKFASWSPNQDRGKKFLQTNLGALRTLQEIPPYTYDYLVRRSSTIDAIWFNERQLPHSFFEVEESTDIQNSLLKFSDLQDFATRMFIVANPRRRTEFTSKIGYASFRDIANRVKFLSCDDLVKLYEKAVEESRMEVLL